MTNDKIPIGRYKWMRSSGGVTHNYIQVKFKDEKKIYDGDIVTLDMIEPYESEAVRKVAKYVYDELYPEHVQDLQGYSLKHARKIVELVHEAEDADE